MKNQYAIVKTEQCYLWVKPGEEEDNQSSVSDEIFSGWAVRILPMKQEVAGTEENQDEEGIKDNRAETEASKFIEDKQDTTKDTRCTEEWVQVETHYGYRGYVLKSQLKEISFEELKNRQNPMKFRKICQSYVDVLAIPKVQGIPKAHLSKNAIVEFLEKGIGDWTKIRTAAGVVGYVHDKFLTLREDSDAYFWTPDPENYFLTQSRLGSLDEEVFRKRVADHAIQYMGTQYRWGGKSALGLDCSGLVFMSYLECGVLIYRDASIVDAYPIRPIPQSKLKKGDLIFFPGHVAMYLGDQKYVHSTADKDSAGVTINSLNPSDPLYRSDLEGKIKGYGSLFA